MLEGKPDFPVWENFAVIKGENKMKKPTKKELYYRVKKLTIIIVLQSFVTSMILLGLAGVFY